MGRVSEEGEERREAAGRREWACARREARREGKGGRRGGGKGGSQAALDAEVALPELAVSGAAGHGPEQVRVDLDHLLHRLRGCARARQAKMESGGGWLNERQHRRPRDQREWVAAPDLTEGLGSGSQMYCPMLARESTAMITPCLKMKPRLARGRRKRETRTGGWRGTERESPRSHTEDMPPAAHARRALTWWCRAQASPGRWRRSESRPAE